MKGLIYSSLLLSDFTQKLVKCGKKEKIEVLIINCIKEMFRIGLKTHFIFLFFEILTKIKPIVDLKPRILKKKKVYVPIMIDTLRQYKKSIGWFLEEILTDEATYKLPLNRKVNACFEKIYFQNYDLKTKKHAYYTQVLTYREYRNYRW